MQVDPYGYRVAIVGATGAVGTTLAELLADRGFPCRQVDLLASSRSAGSVRQTVGGAQRVSTVDEFDFSNTDVAFFTAGSAVSTEHARRAVASGALVIDNTSTFRMQADTPLVVPQVNGSLLDARPDAGVIANPNCATIPLARVLQPIAAEWGIDDVVVSTYQAASGRGRSGVDELTDRTHRIFNSCDDRTAGRVFPEGLALNVIPVIDELHSDGFTVEERKIEQESAKILGLPRLRLTATCVRVPVITGHSEAMFIRTLRPVTRDRVVDVLTALPEVRVANGRDAPTPRRHAGSDEVHVGRVRVVNGERPGVWLWVVSDNLRIGAALNAVQIAEGLRERGAL